VPDVTLTFDNGPEPSVTPHVLDVLANRGVPATFFVVGRRLATPDGRRLAQRARAEGHWIGNHTFTHAAPFGELPAAGRARREIERTQAEIGRLAHPDRLFRPMGGGGNLDERLLTPEALETLLAGRYTCVLWSVVPRDWEDPEGWVERAIGACAGREESLLVLHDVAGGAMDRLERFFDRAAAEGLRFRRDFPADCVPILRGEVVGPLEGLVSRARRTPRG
jgi:peptidoglycan/xylan/chitin deacetylase (PgdA/CDA1 family)